MPAAPAISIFKRATNTQSYAPGEAIFRKGEVGDIMYGVKEGEIEIQIDGTVVETIGPGSILGEMALIDKSPRSADAVAKTAVELSPVDERQFQFLVQQHPFFALQVMQIMASRLRHMNESR